MKPYIGDIVEIIAPGNSYHNKRGVVVKTYLSFSSVMLEDPPMGNQPTDVSNDYLSVLDGLERILEKL